MRGETLFLRSFLKGTYMIQSQTLLDNQEREILQLADSMAAAATSFNSHGYEVFIQAREDFKTGLHHFAELKNSELELS
jgi:hypothetical protein